jgi:hypothetical protein
VTEPANIKVSYPKSSAARADSGSTTEAGWMQDGPSSSARKVSRRSVQCIEVSP